MSKLITTFLSIKNSEKPEFINSIDVLREVIQNGNYIFFVNVAKEDNVPVNNKEALGIRSPFSTYKAAYEKAYALKDTYPKVSIALVETEVIDPSSIPDI